jgi:hypothetical protein
MSAPLEIGTECILLDHCPEFCVLGIIGDIRPHRDDPSRILYHFTCVQIDDSGAVEAVTSDADASGPVIRSWRRPDVKTLVSPDGYPYDCTGWYEESSLEPTDGTGDGTSLVGLLESQHAKQSQAGHSSAELGPSHETQLERLIRRATTDNDPCEIQYLGLSFRPWFTAPFRAMGYIPNTNAADGHVAYSIYLCHRCLGPYADVMSLVSHMELCRVAHPPGYLIYKNVLDVLPSRYHSAATRSPPPEVRAYVIDGAEDVVYCRHLAMLMKSLVESKVIRNDVDLYEFVVVTVNRSVAAAWCAPVMGEAGAEELLRYDPDRWDGHVLAGFYCRLKMLPNVGLSCIATLPCFQKCGVGRLLVRLAYYLGFLRQKYCGCARCGNDGCNIDRPFSVSGSKLLHSTWVSVLKPVLCHLEATDYTFDGLRRRCSEDTFMHLSKEDFMDFLLTNHMGFYATGAEGVVGSVVVDQRDTRFKETHHPVRFHSLMAFDPAHLIVPSTTLVKGLGIMDADVLAHFVRVMFHDMADYSDEQGLAVEQPSCSPAT